MRKLTSGINVHYRACGKNRYQVGTFKFFMIEYDNKYNQYLHKFTKIKTSLSEDKFRLVEINLKTILSTKTFNGLLFTNECLNYFINKDKNKFPDWFINNIESEIKRRDELLTLKNNFFKIKHEHELAGILGLDYGTLVYHIFKVPDNRKYKIFKIPKKTGGYRTLCSPISNIKLIQKKLSEILYEIYIPRINAHGFIPGRGIVTNARIHVKQNAILNIDIKDFFPTINFGRVRGLFLNKPFYFPKWIATLIAQICTYQNQLPQGSPVSPIISNMICSKLDNKLSAISKKYFCYFSRYADDITFSTKKYDFPEELIRKIRIIIEEEGFIVNNNKFRIQKKNQRKEVTGITVNEKLNVKRKYIRKIRAMLSSWEKLGYENANNTFNKKIKPTYPHINFLPRLDNSLHGMIEYVGQVRGKEDNIYLKFLEKYNALNKTPHSERAINNNETDSKVEKREEHNQNPQHVPIKVCELLNSFKKEGSYLKKLVHNDEDKPDLPKILDGAKNEINTKKSILPYELYSNIWVNLIRLYEKEGMGVWNRNDKKHPISITKFNDKIIQFKKDIRFGASSDQTSMFTTIQSIIKELPNKQLENKIKVNPNLDKLDIYTDVQHIRNGLKIIIEHVIKYIDKGNGIRINLSELKWVNEKLYKYEISICNLNSSSYINKQVLIKRFNDLEHDLPKLKDKHSSKGHLFNRCDWYIEAIFDGQISKINVLSKDNPDGSTFEDANPKSNDGFTHILVFYGM